MDSPPGTSSNWAPSIKLIKAFDDVKRPILGVDISKDGSLAAYYTKHDILIYDVISGEMKRHIEVGEAIHNLLLKPTDPTYAFLAVDGNDICDFSEDEKKDKKTEKKEGADGENSEGAEGSPSTKKRKLNEGRKETTEKGIDDKGLEGEGAIGKGADRLRLVNLFQDRLMWEITVRKDLMETIQFISLHPNTESFLMGTTTHVSLWDYSKYAQLNGKKERETVTCQLKMPCYGQLISGAFDSQGMIFAVCVGRGFVHLFDSKTFGKGPFSTFKVRKPCEQLEFSPCGKYLLCGFSTLIDSFDGDFIVEYPLMKEQIPIKIPEEKEPRADGEAKPESETKADQTDKKNDVKRDDEKKDNVKKDDVKKDEADKEDEDGDKKDEADKKDEDKKDEKKSSEEEKTDEDENKEGGATAANAPAANGDAPIAKAANHAANGAVEAETVANGSSANTETAGKEEENKSRGEANMAERFENVAIPIKRAHFSPDSDYVLQITNTNKIHMFSTVNAELVRSISGFDEDTSLHAIWNPSRAMIIVVNGTKMLWWK